MSTISGTTQKCLEGSGINSCSRASWRRATSDTSCPCRFAISAFMFCWYVKNTASASSIPLSSSSSLSSSLSFSSCSSCSLPSRSATTSRSRALSLLSSCSSLREPTPDPATRHPSNKGLKRLHFFFAAAFWLPWWVELKQRWRTRGSVKVLPYRPRQRRRNSGAVGKRRSRRLREYAAARLEEHGFSAASTVSVALRQKLQACYDLLRRQGAAAMRRTHECECVRLCHVCRSSQHR